ncbi:hypothetical protein CHAB381_0604 [Campylobacter hominis ATCC BAA-381]|uniref:Uncharacterized protein n=1 Tax=Campylobacter hominis (strain ATCC BAA-381 / DSM 21671 / CCUG 45161 / LMG 19568 / NCTC 13146 / CH001A) TaxID=360107 RepID=A7I100_CAMHC|nr:hypothetical protein CHAB381_0604 [Campylobacter hominis ATCC BAA-381]
MNLLKFVIARSEATKQSSQTAKPFIKSKFANNKRLTALLDYFEFFKLSQ